MPLDTNVFDKLKTFADYNKADQAFQLQKALQGQQLQTGGIDAATKANVYKTQVLAGAVAGGQPAYDKARQDLQAQGIDTSEFAPDVQTASGQVNAARLAQAPAMQLLNTAIQANRNGIQTSAQTGDAPPSLADTTKVIFGQQPPAVAGAAPPSAAMTPSPTNSAPIVRPGTMPTVQQAMAVNDLYGDQGNSQPARPPAQPVVITPPAANSRANGIPGAGNSLAGNSVPPFVPPANDPTKNMQWNQDNLKNALEVYNNRGDVIAAKTAAGESGKASVEYGEKAAAATELVGRIDKNLDAMLAANPSVPQSRWGVDSKSKAWLSQNVGDQTDAAAYGAFSKVNKAQILNGIQELVQSGSIRNSKALISLVADVNAIDENAAPAIRAQQIGAVRAELHNLATSAGNINARMTGGQIQPYEDIPITAQPAQQPATAGGWSIQKVQ